MHPRLRQGRLPTPISIPGNSNLRRSGPDPAGGIGCYRAAAASARRGSGRLKAPRLGPGALGDLDHDLSQGMAFADVRQRLRNLVKREGAADVDLNLPGEALLG